MSISTATVERGSSALASAEAALPWLLPKLPKWAAAVLIVVLAAQLAALTWKLVPAPEQKAAPKQTVAFQPQSQTQAQRVNINALVKQNLFGKAAAPVAKQQPKITNAPDTTLKIKLAGVILSNKPSLSRALIEVSKGKQKTFAIGDEVTNRTELKEIHAAHVVLERNGRNEILRMQKVKAKKGNTRSNNFSAGGKTLGGDVTADLRKVRQELLSDPSKAGDYIRVRPVNGKGPGDFKGYRIYPGKNRKLFRKAGLRSGDLVKGVNGVQLSSPEAGFSLISSLPTASTITVDVERRGKLETITVNLDQ